MKTVMIAEFTKEAIEEAAQSLIEDGWRPVNKVNYMNGCYFQTLEKKIEA